MFLPGKKAFAVGVALAVGAVIFAGVTGRVPAKIGLASIAIAAIGLVQFLNYYLRSAAGKAAYHDKWGRRGLYHYMMLVATSDGGMDAHKIARVKQIYERETGNILEEKAVQKLAERVASNQRTYVKDFKIYAERILPPMRDKIIAGCLEVGSLGGTLSDTNRELIQQAGRLMGSEVQEIEARLLK